jgi:hypothetical protein
MRAGTLHSVLFLFITTAVACGGAKRETMKDPSDVQDTPPAEEEAPKWEGAAPPQESKTTTTPGGNVVHEAPRHRTDQYDKDATEVVLKRSARQVKENCGATKGENGKAEGPWGKATIQIQLGHNDHSKGVTVPPPYQGQPVGNCVEMAFTNLTFPPWAGSDTTVEWEVEIVQPKDEKAK